MSSAANAFRDADALALPDLHQLDGRRQVFWILRVAKEQLDRPTMTPAEISVVLRDAYGINVARQRIEATLAAENETVARRDTKGRRVYQLMAAGGAELDSASGGAIFVDPTSGFTGLRQTHAVLAALKGDVRVCDPYTDARTLDMLAEIGSTGSIRLLTRNIKGPDGLKQAVKAFQQEHGGSLEIRKSAPGVLHDRYAIHDDGMLLFGTSLNGLGLKQSFVVALGEDLRSAALAAFEATWDPATPL